MNFFCHFGATYMDGMTGDPPPPPFILDIGPDNESFHKVWENSNGDVV